MSSLTHFGYIDFTGNNIEDIQTAINGISSSLIGHTAQTVTHGTGSDIVGKDDVQTLTNKTIDTASNTIQLNGLALNNSATDILVNDGGVLKYKDLSSFNPFDQDLNTTDSVTHTGLTINNTDNTSSIKLLNIENNSTNESQSARYAYLKGYEPYIHFDSKNRAFPSDANSGIVFNHETNNYIGSIYSNLYQSNVNDSTLVVECANGPIKLSAGVMDLTIPKTALAIDNTASILAIKSDAGVGTLSKRDDVVTLTGGQTLSNKSLLGGYSGSVFFADTGDTSKKMTFDTASAMAGTTTYIRSQSTVDRTLNLPDSSDTLVGQITSQSLFNKTINTAGPNTVQINGTDITSIISGTNPLLSTSSPSFVGATINSPGTVGISINTPAGGHPGIALNSVGNAYVNFNADGGTHFQAGALSSISKSVLWASDGYPLSLGTSGMERLLIPSTGIPSGSTSDNILTLNGTQLEYRTVSSLPIVNPFNQSLNTTDKVRFANLQCASAIKDDLPGVFGLSMGLSATNSVDIDFVTDNVSAITFKGAGNVEKGSIKYYNASGNLYVNIDGTNTTLQVAKTNFYSEVPLNLNVVGTVVGKWTVIKGAIFGASFSQLINFPVTTSCTFQIRLTANGISGGLNEYGIGEYDYSFKAIWYAGALDLTAGVDSNKSEKNIGLGGFGGKLSFTTVVSGNSAIIRLTSSAAFNIYYAGFYRVLIG